MTREETIIMKILNDQPCYRLCQGGAGYRAMPGDAAQACAAALFLRAVNRYCLQGSVGGTASGRLRLAAALSDHCDAAWWAENNPDA